MPSVNAYNLKGLNLKLSPFSAVDGSLLRCTNMYTDQVGAKTKRWGYEPFLDNPDDEPVNTLAQFTKNDGTSTFLYRASGSSVYYYDLGVGTATSWTKCAGGTIDNGAGFGYTTFDDTFILGDGVGSTKHSTDGSTLIDTGGTLGTPPIGRYITNEFGRVFIAGTASDVFYSSANNGTAWLLSGAYDSSSFKVTGGGKLNGLYPVADRVLVTKNNGTMKKWDDYQLTTVPTLTGYIKPDSVANMEGYLIGFNDLGIYGFGGDRMEILSNPVEFQIYNRFGQHAPSIEVDNNFPAVAYKYKYLINIDNSPDGRSGNRLNYPVLVYDAQLDEWVNWNFDGVGPTSFLNYRDREDNQQKILFGDSLGQVYLIKENAYSDTRDGVAYPIECLLEGFIHANKPEEEKIWKKVTAFANPGCQATLMLAASDSFLNPTSIVGTTLSDNQTLNYVTVGSLTNGVIEYRGNLRGRFLYYKVIESSTTYPFVFYGLNVEYDFIGD